MTDCIPCKQTGSTLTDCGSVATSGDCNLNDDGTQINPPQSNSDSSCMQSIADGRICPQGESCSPWDLTESNDATCLTEMYIEEQLNIAGAKLNVYKLLGIHEQGLLQDLTGNGNAISSGSLSNFDAANAFDKYQTEWRSAQTNTDVISNGYIGYDFGPLKLSNGRERYGLETSVKHEISLIKIKQGCDAKNRATKIRVERSDDGIKWYGVSVLDVQDCDGLISLPFKKTVPSRFWRIRPVKFNGGEGDYWVIQALQMMDYEKTDISNIQDRLLLENRDRDYMTDAVGMKCYYTPIDVQSAASKFGFYQTETYTLEVSFRQALNTLGRPFVIGDIVQLPSETQYTPTMQPVLKYLEVTDVAWSVNSYTANWLPTMQRLLAIPAMASQETQQIFGKLTEDIDTSGLVDISGDGSNKKYQDVSNISKTVRAKANTAVPERGEDRADIAKISDDALEYSKQHPNMNLNKLNIKKSLYSKDGLPPNGESYTEGDSWPMNPKNGAYHRLTYTSLGKNKEIPPKLYRFSSRKGIWLFIEDDKRFAFRKTKPILQDFIDPATSTVTDPANEETDILNKN